MSTSAPVDRPSPPIRSVVHVRPGAAGSPPRRTTSSCQPHPQPLGSPRSARTAGVVQQHAVAVPGEQLGVPHGSGAVARARCSRRRRRPGCATGGTSRTAAARRPHQKRDLPVRRTRGVHRRPRGTCASAPSPTTSGSSDVLHHDQPGHDGDHRAAHRRRRPGGARPVPHRDQHTERHQHEAGDGGQQPVTGRCPARSTAAPSRRAWSRSPAPARPRTRARRAAEPGPHPAEEPTRRRRGADGNGERASRCW